MTTTEYTPLLRNGSSRSIATQHHLPIQSHYFDITDIESWPIAGLLVLLDGQTLPVRAELHLYDDLQPQVQETAIRQARLVLQEQYPGGAPVPMRILETFQVREEMTVRLPPLGARPAAVPSIPLRWRPHGMIGVTIAAMAIIMWLTFTFLEGGLGARRGGDDSTADSTTPTEISQAESTVDAETNEQSAGDQSSDQTGDQSGDVQAVSGSAGTETNLPVSRNARTDLGIGVRVQVVPGLRIALRSEPSAERGVTIGEMTEGDVATIVAGPEYTQGDTDTIVWWFVTLANGTQAWAAANTSQQTLLMPAP